MMSFKDNGVGMSPPKQTKDGRNKDSPDTHKHQEGEEQTSSSPEYLGNGYYANGRLQRESSKVKRQVGVRLGTKLYSPNKDGKPYRDESSGSQQEPFVGGHRGVSAGREKRSSDSHGMRYTERLRKQGLLEEEKMGGDGAGSHSAEIDRDPFAPPRQAKQFQNPRWKGRDKQVEIPIPAPIVASTIPPRSLRGSRNNSVSDLAQSLWQSIMPASAAIKPFSDPRKEEGATARAWKVVTREERRTREGVQELLDQQGEALMAAMGRDTTSSRAGSRRGGGNDVGTNMSIMGGGNRSLGSARRGILRSLQAFGNLATRKEEILRGTHRTLKQAHRQLEIWHNALQTTDQKILALEQTANESRADQTAADIRDVTMCIVELELELKELKEKKAKLSKKHQREKSTEEARVAKYVYQKQDVEKEVKRWFARPPEAIWFDVNAEQAKMKEEIVVTLKRYSTLTVTPEMVTDVKDVFLGVVDGMQSVIKEVVREKEACVQGADMWQVCCERIDGFELLLRKFIKAQMGGTKSMHDLWVGEKDGREMIAELKEMRKLLEDCLTTAEEEGWNLLVCAVGPEIEALRVAEGVLEGMVRDDRVDGENGEEIKRHGISHEQTFVSAKGDTKSKDSPSLRKGKQTTTASTSSLRADTDGADKGEAASSSDTHNAWRSERFSKALKDFVGSPESADLWEMSPPKQRSLFKAGAANSSRQAHSNASQSPRRSTAPEDLTRSM